MPARAEARVRARLRGTGRVDVQGIWGNQKGGLENLRFDHFPQYPFVKRCLLVWDSGLQLVHDN